MDLRISLLEEIGGSDSQLDEEIDVGQSLLVNVHFVLVFSQGLEEHGVELLEI